jgi:hypothetical protein
VPDFYVSQFNELAQLLRLGTAGSSNKMEKLSILDSALSVITAMRQEASDWHAQKAALKAENLQLTAMLVGHVSTALPAFYHRKDAPSRMSATVKSDEDWGQEIDGGVRFGLAAGMATVPSGINHTLPFPQQQQQQQQQVQQQTKMQQQASPPLYRASGPIMDGEGSRQQALRFPLSRDTGANMSFELVVQPAGNGSPPFPVVLPRHQSPFVGELGSLGMGSLTSGSRGEQFWASNSLEQLQSTSTQRQQHPHASQSSPVLHSDSPVNGLGASSRCCDTLSGFGLSSFESTRSHSRPASTGAGAGSSSSSSSNTTASYGVNMRVHALSNEQGMLNTVGERTDELSSPHSVSAGGVVGRTSPAAPIDTAIFQMEDELSGSAHLTYGHHQ